MFINTLPLRNELTGEKTVHEFLKEVKENTLSAFDNQDYHYEELVQKLGYERDPGRNPLFDIIFALQNIKISPLEIEGLGLALYPLGHKISKFDLTVMASEVRNRIELVYEYRSKLFKEETIRRMNRHFKNIIKEVVMNPRTKISRIEMMDDDEKAMLKKKIRYKRAPIFNNTKITQEKTLKIEAEFNF
jgi:non-ribosomal peptide synthetase component F